MDISHQGKLHAPVESITSDVLSNRRVLWMAGFAFSSIAMFLTSPGIGLSLAFVVVLSLSHVIFVDRWTDHYLRRPVMGAIAGSALAAMLLWVSVLAGSAAVTLIDASSYGNAVFLASSISLVSFAILVAVESILAMVLQFLIAKGNTAAAHIACVLDMKFAGLFGEIR